MAKKEPTLEEALRQLESLAQEIERGEIGLEESIQKYEQGMKLVAHCRAILTRAEQRIQELQPPAESPTPDSPLSSPPAEPGDAEDE